MYAVLSLILMDSPGVPVAYAVRVVVCEELCSQIPDAVPSSVTVGACVYVHPHLCALGFIAMGRVSLWFVVSREQVLLSTPSVVQVAEVITVQLP